MFGEVGFQNEYAVQDISFFLTISRNHIKIRLTADEIDFESRYFIFKLFTAVPSTFSRMQSTDKQVSPVKSKLKHERERYKRTDRTLDKRFNLTSLMYAM